MYEPLIFGENDQKKKKEEIMKRYTEVEKEKGDRLFTAVCYFCPLFSLKYWRRTSRARSFPSEKMMKQQPTTKKEFRNTQPLFSQIT